MQKNNAYKNKKVNWWRKKKLNLVKESKNEILKREKEEVNNITNSNRGNTSKDKLARRIQKKTIKNMC